MAACAAPGYVCIAIAVCAVPWTWTSQAYSSLSAPGHAWSMVACAAPGCVWSMAACAAPGRVWSTEVFVAPEIACLQQLLLPIDV